MAKKEVEEVLEKIQGRLQPQVENRLYELVRDCEEANAYEPKTQNVATKSYRKQEIIKSTVEEIIEKVKQNILQEVYER